MMKVNLGSVDYEVSMTDKADKQLGEETRGIVYYEDLKIFLDKNLPEQRIVQTLYHEISHAICEQTSFNGMLMDKLGDNGYEIFIDNMGKVLYNFIHNNDLKELENFIINKDTKKSAKKRDN